VTVSRPQPAEATSQIVGYLHLHKADVLPMIAWFVERRAWGMLMTERAR
jgi:hypothetical protein